MRFLGIVKDVSQFEVCVSLTECLTGYIAVSEFVRAPFDKKAAKKTLRDAETVAQLRSLLLNKSLLCTVKRVQPGVTTKLILSASPHGSDSPDGKSLEQNSLFHRGDLVYGLLDTVEENGVTVDTALQGISTAFVPFKAAKGVEKYFFATSRRSSRKAGEKAVGAGATKAGGKPPRKGKAGEKARDALREATEKFFLPAWFLLRKTTKPASKESGGKGGLASLRFSSKPLLRSFVSDFEAIQPGDLVRCAVVEVFSNGVKVLFLDIFYGVVDEMNSDKPIAQHSVGEALIARVVFVDYRNKKVLLSTKKGLLKALGRGAFSRKEMKKMEKGLVIEDALVVANNRHNGVFLAAKIGGENFPAFCHASHLSDKAAKKSLLNKCQVGKKLKCRVYDVSNLCGLILVTAQESLVDQQIFKVADIKPGDFVKGELLSFEKYGLLLSLTPKVVNAEKMVKGVIPLERLSDYPLKDPTAKFEIGRGIKCRVLNVELAMNRVFLTRQKTMLKSELPIIVDSNPKINLVTYGCVVAILEHGLLLSFYGGICGFLSNMEIKQAGYNENPRDIFYKGQPLKVRVNKIKPDDQEPTKNKIYLSLELEKKSAVNQNWLALKTRPASDFLSVGDITSGRIKLLLDQKILIELELSEESSRKQTGCQTVRSSAENSFVVLGELYYNNLTDFKENIRLLKESLSGGDKLDALAILSFKSDGRALVTLKKSVVNRISEGIMPSTSSALKENSLQIGTIKKIMQSGILIGFLGSNTSFCPKSYVKDLNSAAPAMDEYEVGETVLVKMVHSYSEKSICSMRARDLIKSPLVPLFVESSVDYFEETNDLKGKSVEGLLLKDIKDTLLSGVIYKIENFRVYVDISQTHAAMQKIFTENAFEIVAITSSENHSIGDAVEMCFIDFVVEESIANKVANDPKEKVKRVYIVFKVEKGNKSDLSNSEMDKRVVPAPGSKMDFEVAFSTEKVSFLVEKEKGLVGVAANFAFNLKFNLNATGTPKQIRQAEIIKTMGKAVLVIFPPTHVLKTSPLNASVRCDSANTQTAGNYFDCTVKRVDFQGLYVDSAQLKGFEGFVHFSEISDNLSDLYALKTYVEKRKESEGAPSEEPDAFQYPQSAVVKCRLLRFESDRALLSMRKSMERVCFFGKVVKKTNDVWLVVEIGYRFLVRIHITNIALNWTDDPFKTIEDGEFIKVYNTDGFYQNLPEKIGKLYSLFPMDTSSMADSPYLKQLKNDINCEDIVFGYVKKSDKLNGIFVTLNPLQDAVVYKKDLSAGYVNDIAKEFYPGKLVKARVITVEDGKVRVSLKERDMNISFESITEGSRVNGTIIGAKNFGLFVRLENSLIALCHVSQIENKSKLTWDDLIKHYESKIGTEQSFNVSKVDLGRKRISLKMIDNTKSAANGTPDAEDFGESIRKTTGKKTLQDELVNGGDEQEKSVADGEDSLSSESEDDKDEIINDKEVEKMAFPLEVGEDVQEDFSEFLVAEKESIERENTSKVDNVERGTTKPEGTENEARLETLIRAEPNVAENWIQCIKQNLEVAKIDVAREIGQKALKTISFDAEAERLKIWTALVEIEVNFGTADSLDAVVKEGVLHNDSTAFYRLVLEILISKEKFSSANTIFVALLSLHKKEIPFWISYAKFLHKYSAHLSTNCALKKNILLKESASTFSVTSAEAEKRRDGNLKILLGRALEVFDKRTHLKILILFAKTEFQFGSENSARKMFDDVLSAYPGKLDVWTTSLDLEMEKYSLLDGVEKPRAAEEANPEGRNNNGSAQQKEEQLRLCRESFEKALNAGLPLEKAKFVFGRYLSFERKYGGDERVEGIKEKAKKYAKTIKGFESAKE